MKLAIHSVALIMEDSKVSLLLLVKNLLAGLESLDKQINAII